MTAGAVGADIPDTLLNVSHDISADQEASPAALVRLLVHELVHVRQARGGLADFGYRYFAGFARADGEASYNPREREAAAVA